MEKNVLMLRQLKKPEFDSRMDSGFFISSENDDSYKNGYIYVQQV